MHLAAEKRQNGSTSAPTKHASHVVNARLNVNLERDQTVCQLGLHVFGAAENSGSVNLVRRGRGRGQQRKGEGVSLF